jgi:non-heme chloroperoxidase
MLSTKLIRSSKLRVHKGAPHGMCMTLKDRANAELLAFLK